HLICLSFPTRRSSDLCLRSVRRLRLGGELVVLDELLRVSFDQLPQVADQAAASRLQGQVIFPGLQPLRKRIRGAAGEVFGSDDGDRKSTRLNSSHGSI